MSHGSVTVGRRRALAACVLGVSMMAGLAGCQKAISVGAHNACGFPIDVSIDEVSTRGSYDWTTVDDGQHRYARTVTSSMTVSVVSVRRSEGDPISHFTVAKQDHAVPPTGSDYDLEVTIEGDHCPA